MAQEKPIKVMLGNATCSGTDFVTRPPLIFVRVGADTNFDPAIPAWPSTNGKLYYALLDTGATNTAIDQAAANEIGAIISGTARLHGWKGGETHAQVTKIQIVLSEAGAVFCDCAAIRDFRGEGQSWDVLLGRTFLKHCHFGVDGPNSRYYLDWIAE
jgi:predicted aspartyl protease